ncbi:MAG: hypothetical protein NZL89_00930 [Leptospiraceae bacterium]|nr:hypothetical protein [Leptospiraceae bacterium]
MPPSWPIWLLSALFALAPAITAKTAHTTVEEGIFPDADGLEPEDRDPILSNCNMEVKMWGAAGYIYTEFLLFSPPKPPNTAKPVAQNSRK